MGDFEDEKVASFIESIKTLDLEERIKNIPSILHNWTPSGRKELEHHWQKSVNLVKYLVEYRKQHQSPTSDVEFFDYLAKETTAESGQNIALLC